MVTLWAMYLLFFLTPLFFLPWTSNVLEVNKQMLLVILTVVALVAWLGQMVIGKRLTFKAGWLNLVPGLFFVAVLTSSVLSIAGYQTWVGQASQEYMSFLSTGMFVALFYILMNGFSSTILQRNILFALLLSGGITGLVTLLGMFDLVHLPFSFAASKGFNTIGTMNGFIGFMTTVMFAGQAMWLVSHQGRDRVIPLGTMGNIMRLLVVVVTVVNLVALIAVDFSLFWIINIVGVLLLSVFVFIQSQEFPRPGRFALPLVVLLVSLAFLFLQSPLQLGLPVVVSPSYGTSWDVTKDTLNVSTGQLLFGSGPGTWLYDYLAYKPQTVNNSPFWTLRFDRAKSSLMTTVASLGLVGTLLWLVLMGWVGVKAVSRLLLERDHEEWKMTYVLFIGWFILLLTHVLYSSNFTMQFMLWGFTGLLASQAVVKTWKSDFARSPKIGLATSLAFVVVAVGVIASLFVTGSRYAAEMAFARGVELDQKDGASIEAVISYLEKAVKLNGFSDTYQRNLSSAYLRQAREAIEDAGGSELTTAQTQQVLDIVEKAIESSNVSTSIEPNYVSNWVVQGSLYRDLMSFAQGAEDLAAQAFLNAIQLEGINPVHRTNLGRVYLTVAERARALGRSEDPEMAANAVQQEARLLETAEQAFSGAVELKSDYLPAHYYLAATYERQGKLDQALARLVALRNNNLADTGLAFQLSQLLIRLGEYQLAANELSRIIELSPDYSNALWYMASMYEIGNQPEGAAALVRRVVELNPNNEVARERLRRLNNGELTTVIPEPIQSGQGAATSVDEGEIIEELPEDSPEAQGDVTGELVEDDGAAAAGEGEDDPVEEVIDQPEE